MTGVGGAEPTRVDAAPDDHAPQVPLGSRRDRRKGHELRWIIISAVLTVLLILVSVLSNHLWGVSRAWEQQVAELDAANHDLGTRIAAEQSEVARLTDEIDLLSQQLATAQQRITELADINAQAGDNVQYYVQNITQLTDSLNLATTVAASLNRCVDGQEQLLHYVRNAANYNPADVAQFEASLNTLCDNAVAANLTLQKEQKP